jgi:hypothetical protein
LTGIQIEALSKVFMPRDVYHAVIALAGLLGIPPVDAAYAEGCERATIQSVSSDGLVIVLDNGSVYRVADTDQGISVLWVPFDDVEVCYDVIVDDDRDEEKVKVSPRN